MKIREELEQMLLSDLLGPAGVRPCGTYGLLQLNPPCDNISL
jgi:hypothetical protein